MNASKKQSSKMAESRARLGERQRNKSRQAIIDAAVEVFQEKTPDAAVIGDVISAAGVARGTFYNHFKDVDEVCSAVAIRLSTELRGAVLAVLSDVADPAERVAVSVRHFLHRCARDPKWGWVIVRVAHHGPLDALFREAFRPEMEAGRASGRFLPLDTEVGADVLTGTALAAMRTELEGRASANHAEDVVAAILRGLGVDRAEAQDLVNRPLPRVRP